MTFVKACLRPLSHVLTKEIFSLQKGQYIRQCNKQKYSRLNDSPPRIISLKEVHLSSKISNGYYIKPVA